MHSGEYKTQCANWFVFLILQLLVKKFCFALLFSHQRVFQTVDTLNLQHDASLRSIILNELAKPKENIENLHCVNRVYCELLREELSYCNNIDARKASFLWILTDILKEISLKSITKEPREGVKSFAETRRGDFVRPERESKHRATIIRLQSRLTHLRGREPGYLNLGN